MGPNEKRMVTCRMAQIMIPPSDGLMDGMKALQSDIVGVSREASAWVKEAIKVVRSAPDCPWKTDEEIAGEILKRMK